MSRSERSRHSRRGQKPRGKTVAAEAAAAGDVDPTRFEVRCACGVTMRGQRHEDEHSVICSSCGTELPLDTRGVRTASRQPAVTAESQRVQDAKLAPTIANVTPERAVGTDSGDPPAGLHPERLEQRRHVTSLRILALAVLLLVTATVYWGWHNRRQQRFLLELQNATGQGEAALAEGQFDRAVELLAEADRAARGLHSTDSQGRLASQLYREAQAWANLAVEGVDEFCFARAADAAAGADRLIGEFDRELAGRSVIIQTRGYRIAQEYAPQIPQAAPAEGAPAEQAVTQKSQTGPLPLALDWIIAGDNFRVEIDPRDLAGISGVAPAGEQELVFGAELRALERDPRHAGGWLIRLVPKSCVLLTAPGPFASINWPDHEQLEQLLGAQRARILPETAAAEKAGEAAMNRYFANAILMLASVLGAQSAVVAQTLEVHELEANSAAHLGKPVIIHGRLQSAGGGHLHLVGSSIDCRYTESRVPIRPGTTHVELEGRLSREQDKLVFHIDSLSSIHDEVAEFAARRQKIPDGKFSALYELSRWARARAKWYDDAKLRQRASNSFREAFSWEEEALARESNVAELLALADRGEQLGLEPADVQRIRFRALVLRRSKLLKGDQAGWQLLADDIRRLLPATDQPATANADRPDAKSVDELTKAYAAADGTARAELHRGLWAAAVTHVFDLKADSRTANLLELAKEATRVLPDRPGLARRLELDGWRREAAHPDQLSREAVVATSAGLTRLEQPDAAQSLVEHWLRGRRDKLPKDEAEDRIQLAEDCLELANDRRQAAELYREAWGIVPDFPAAAAGLRQLGFELVGGTWREAKDLSAATTETESFLRAGVGEAEVVRRLRRPDQVTRTATRRGIIEQWTYAGPPSLVVYLRRDVAGGGATVTRATQVD